MDQNFDLPTQRAVELANELRAVRRESRQVCYERLANVKPLQEWQRLALPPIKQRNVQQFDALVKKLANILADAGWNSKRSEVNSKTLLLPGQFWSVGVTTTHFHLRPIHGGFLEPVLRVPVLSEVPEIVIDFLISLPDDDYLDREHHDFVGWHYHYLTWREERTNIVLCWDTRAPQHPNNRSHPLFHEEHGEGHVFRKARPDLWGDWKCKTMHDSCYPDLSDWKLSEFRCASSKASPVWPKTATLTPIPKPPTASVKHASKKHRKRRR